MSTVGKVPLPRTSSQMFVAMAALSQILSAVLTTFYTLKGAEHMLRSTAEEVERIKAYFELQLSQFHNSYLASLLPVADVFLDPTGQ